MAPSEILVVDDDRSVRELLGDLLSLEGYHVTLAEDGAKALAAIRKGPSPDVVLLDLMMPVMSGFEFLEVVEADKTLCTLPIIVVSALPAPVSADHAVGGIKGSLGKPIDVSVLLAALQRLCAA